VLTFIIIIIIIIRRRRRRRRTGRRIYKSGYDRQSVQSMTGRLSCNKTALKHYISTEQNAETENWSL